MCQNFCQNFCNQQGFSASKDLQHAALEAFTLLATESISPAELVTFSRSSKCVHRHCCHRPSHCFIRYQHRFHSRTTFSHFRILQFKAFLSPLNSGKSSGYREPMCGTVMIFRQGRAMRNKTLQTRATTTETLRFCSKNDAGKATHLENLSQPVRNVRYNNRVCRRGG